jgi:hypothetical protein
MAHEIICYFGAFFWEFAEAGCNSGFHRLTDCTMKSQDLAELTAFPSGPRGERPGRKALSSALPFCIGISPLNCEFCSGRTEPGLVGLLVAAVGC